MINKNLKIECEPVSAHRTKNATPHFVFHVLIFHIVSTHTPFLREGMPKRKRNRPRRYVYVVTCGDENWTDHLTIEKSLQELCSTEERARCIVVQGFHLGADRIVARIASRLGFPVQSLPLSNPWEILLSLRDKKIRNILVFHSDFFNSRKVLRIFLSARKRSIPLSLYGTLTPLYITPLPSLWRVFRHTFPRIILVGGGGAGKDFLRTALQKCGLQFSPSFTSRSPRPGEIAGQDYHFVERAFFENEPAHNSIWLEKQEFAGNYYGTTRAQWSAKSHRVFIMSPPALSSISAKQRRSCVVMFLDISEEIRRERLKKRNLQQPVPSESRLSNDAAVFSQFRNYDVHITNAQFTVSEVFSALLQHLTLLED